MLNKTFMIIHKVEGGGGGFGKLIFVPRIVGEELFLPVNFYEVITHPYTAMKLSGTVHSTHTTLQLQLPTAVAHLNNNNNNSMPLTTLIPARTFACIDRASC